MNSSRISLWTVAGIALCTLAIGHTVVRTAANSSEEHVTQQITNIKMLGTAVKIYITDYDDRYMPHTYYCGTRTATVTWADVLWPYTRNHSIYTSPLIPIEMVSVPFQAGVGEGEVPRYGGIGFNYQFLGNGYVYGSTPGMAFTTSEREVEIPAETVMFMDTQGVRNDSGHVTAGLYVIDPPHPSSRGSGFASGFIGVGDECGSGEPGTPGQFGCRAAPGAWFDDRVTVNFTDTSTRRWTRAQIDKHDADGLPSNHYFRVQKDAD